LSYTAALGHADQPRVCQLLRQAWWKTYSIFSSNSSCWFRSFVLSFLVVCTNFKVVDCFDPVDSKHIAFSVIFRRFFLERQLLFLGLAFSLREWQVLRRGWVKIYRTFRSNLLWCFRVSVWYICRTYELRVCELFRRC
jgi:hypothetical protein